MRTNILSGLLIPGLVIFVLCGVNCAKKTGPTDREVVEQLRDHLNTRMPGSQFKIHPETAIVAPVD